MDPTAGQLQALKAIICHLLAHHYREVIAYGAGWTDRERQQPVGDTGRHEPRHIDAILDAELQRALDDPDPLRGIAQLAARWAAAFVLDPDGDHPHQGARHRAHGPQARRRPPRRPQPAAHRRVGVPAADALPRLAALNRDAFMFDEPLETTVDLDTHRAASDLDDLDLGEDDQDPVAA